MRDGDEFLRFAGRRQSGLSVGLAPSYQMIPLGKPIGHSYSPTSHFSFFSLYFLSCSLFLPSNTFTFPIPQISAQNGFRRPLCPPFRFSYALAEAPHCAHFARNGFPAGKYPELLAERILYDCAQFLIDMSFESNMMLTYFVLSCSAGKEVH